MKLSESKAGDEKKYKLREIIMELREEELRNRLVEEYDRLTISEGYSPEDALEKLNQTVEFIKGGEGPLAEFEKGNYESKMSERFRELKNYYEDIYGDNLEKFQKWDNGPYEFPERVKEHLKHDLRRGVSNLQEIQRKKDERDDALWEVKKTAERLGSMNIDDPEYLRKISKAAQMVNEYREVKARPQETVSRHLKDLDLSAAMGDEISQKLNDIIGFLALTGRWRRELFTELQPKVDKYLSMTAKESLKLPPVEGLEVLLDLRDELIPLLKKYAAKASLKAGSMPEVPGQEEIENLQNNTSRKKLLELIDIINTD